MLWRQHLISGSVITGQTISNLSPPVQTTVARPVTLVRAIIEANASISSSADHTVFFGTTVISADALTALAAPDADAAPGQPWHWWDAIHLPFNTINHLRQFDIRSARIVRPDFRFVLVINGESNNSVSVNVDVKLRLLWKL